MTESANFRIFVAASIISESINEVRNHIAKNLGLSDSEIVDATALAFAFDLHDIPTLAEKTVEVDDATLKQFEEGLNLQAMHQAIVNGVDQAEHCDCPDCRREQLAVVVPFRVNNTTTPDEPA